MRPRDYAYYNEHDSFAAAWLRELIAAGEIAPGEVDERSIADVEATDLVGFSQCHFFAGIGGWSLALRLAGWPDDRPVWTGSCPCQPFSAAGKGRGHADERHLWPEFFRLIRECGPHVVFGEQVESAVRHGWLDGVSADLEGEGYAVGAVVLGAHSVGAPHIRQRLWWVADSERSGRDGWALDTRGREVERVAAAGAGEGGRVADSDGRRWDRGEPRPDQWRLAGENGEDHSGLADADVSGQPGPWRLVRSGDSASSAHRQEHRTVDARGGHWTDSILVPCADGKARRIEPGIEPLAHGIPARVGRLRGYGNAIVPQVAAAFVAAFCEVQP